MNAEAWTDDAFDAPLAESPVLPGDPARLPLALSLASMVTVLLAFVLPFFGSWLALTVAGLSLSRLARLDPEVRRTIPLHLRRRVRRRAMSAAGFATLFAVLWAFYLF
ncbi:MAG: hypothetical protein KC912_05625 [Proteobacteria bacterium]|nr:hypothetical protein [Pseudomonadota bacterium]